jgi:excisionase family DNA binding protein
MHEPHHNTPTLLTVSQVQDRLGGCSRQTVYRLVHQGEMTLVHVLGRSRITLESLQAYLARQVDAATPARGIPRASAGD